MFNIKSKFDSELIQTATFEGGLPVDRFKMYRPGPASAKALNGATKGTMKYLLYLKSEKIKSLAKNCLV